MALDIRVLRRLGALRLGECVITPVHWSNSVLSASSARLRVDLSDPKHGGAMIITASMDDCSLSQRVELELVGAPLGGHRCYFRCPITNRRCEVLYFGHGRFASRTAQLLSYASQNMCEISRVLRKAQKLKCRLTGEHGFRSARGSHRIAIAATLHDAGAELERLSRERLRAHVASGL